MPPAITTGYPAPSDSSLLILQIKKNPSWHHARVARLLGDDAQCVADFLSQLLYEDDALSPDDRKCLLALLQRLVKSAQVLPQCYKLQDVQCDFSQAREGGSFADIFQGQYREQKVCVKAVRIFQRGDNTRMLKAFVKEIVLWAHLSHENILPFYGIYQGVSGRICIISPWVDPGDLSVYLQKFPRRPRRNLVLDITAGLQYLHQSDIVHGDLKAKNILVSSDGRALIADFGISRIVVSTKLVSTQFSSGTMRWMAPELLIDDGESYPPVTLKSDIWSLGCVYYEIFTRKIPFYHCANDARLALVRLDPKAIPRKPTDGSEEDNINDDLWWLMEKCWDSEPSSRPCCNDVHTLVTDLFGVHEQQLSREAALWRAVRCSSAVGPTNEGALRIMLSVTSTSCQQSAHPLSSDRPMHSEKLYPFMDRLITLADSQQLVQRSNLDFVQGDLFGHGQHFPGSYPGEIPGMQWQLALSPYTVSFSENPLLMSATIRIASGAGRKRAAKLVCDMCGAGLTSEHNLIVHRNVHFGFKPFRCEICQKGFTAKSTFRRHTKVVHHDRV